MNLASLKLADIIGPGDAELVSQSIPIGDHIPDQCRAFPGKLVYFGVKLQESRVAAAEAKDALKRAAAEADARIRQDAADTGAKITETAVANRVLSDAAYRESEEVLRMAELRAGVYQTLYDAMRAHGDMLTNLTHFRREEWAAQGGVR